MHVCSKLTLVREVPSRKRRAPVGGVGERGCSGPQSRGLVPESVTLALRLENHVGQLEAADPPHLVLH